MGAAGSRAAGRSYAAVEKSVSNTIAKQSIESAPTRVALDAQRAAEQRDKRDVLSLEDEEQLEGKDEALGTLLDKLGVAIQGHIVDILPSKEQLAASPKTTATTANDSRGRLPPAAVAELFELQGQAAGKTPDISHLIRKYQVDPQLVAQVLSVSCRPSIVETPGITDVAAFAQWPLWFKRRT